MLTFFGMVTRLTSDPLNIHARYALTTTKTTSRSWFCQIRDICLLYSLPHPLSLMSFPPSKDEFKKRIKAHVISYWEDKLRGEAALLPSLTNFKPEFMSLKTPHLLWRTARSNPYEVAGYLEKHWSSNREGICYNCLQAQETIEHILISCISYQETKKNLYNLWLSANCLSTCLERPVK